MQAGQTLAIAGLVQTASRRKTAAALDQRSALPGAAFRNVQETQNEVELLILVTPELVEAMDASEVPPCGPGMQTTSPSDWELFMKGHLEVPNCCPRRRRLHGAVPAGRRRSERPAAGRDDRARAKPIPAPPLAGRRSPRGPQTRYNSSKPNAARRRSPPGPQDGPPPLDRPHRL